GRTAAGAPGEGGPLGPDQHLWRWGQRRAARHRRRRRPGHGPHREMSDLLTQLKAFEGQEVGPPEVGADPVNIPMIRHWCEAVGDDNPVYLDEEAAKNSVHGQVIAPPTMLQAWVMRGVRPRPATGGNARDEL